MLWMRWAWRFQCSPTFGSRVSARGGKLIWLYRLDAVAAGHCSPRIFL